MLAWCVMIHSEAWRFIMNTISVRVDSEKAKLLDILSTELNRSRNYIVNQAIDSYLNNEAYHLQELLKSSKEADDGKLLSHEKVMIEMAEIIDSHSD